MYFFKNVDFHVHSMEEATFAMSVLHQRGAFTMFVLYQMGACACAAILWGTSAGATLVGILIVWTQELKTAKLCMNCHNFYSQWGHILPLVFTRSFLNFIFTIPRPFQHFSAQYLYSILFIIYFYNIFSKKYLIVQYSWCNIFMSTFLNNTGQYLYSKSDVYLIFLI